MSHEFQIRFADSLYESKSFKFSGGELQVSVPGLPPSFDGDVAVLSRLQSADSLVRLALLSEILCRSHRSGRRRLVAPYFPYARQDRVMQASEAFSLKAIARLINSLGFNEVVTFDPHSDVTPALVENVCIVPQNELVKSHKGIGNVIHSGITIVAPDAGAAKKAFAVANYYGLPLVTASKVRDVRTGEITRTEVPDASAVAGRSALIADDICDGGRTFIELAKVLRGAGASKVYLYVTHGIFSQGLGVFEGLIDAVFTTDSFLSPAVESPLQQPVPLYVSSIERTCP